MDNYLVKYETGCTAADCYQEVVVANSPAEASQIIKESHTRAMVTYVGLIEEE